MSDSTGFGLKDLEYLVNGEYASGSSSTSRPLGVLNRPLNQIDANVRLLANILAVQHKSDGSLKDLSVEEGMLADGAVTQNKIASGAVTLDKIASGVITNLPVGFIYFQLRGQQTPDQLFGSSGKWQDISSTYAGEFFRAVGGNSASFGSKQNEGLPNISGTVNYANNDIGLISSTGLWGGAFRQGWKLPNRFSTGVAGGGGSYFLAFDASSSSNTYGASTHVTPYNSAIRIWKKIS